VTHIPIMVKVVSDVVPGASIEREFSDRVITSCSNCGGIYFYQIVEHVGKHATDTVIYCCQCGQRIGGILLDPFDELDENGELKKQTE